MNLLLYKLKNNIVNIVKMSQPKSVIIVGAGLAGLTAADQILKADQKIKVIVLQAMEAPGGRTRSIKLHGAKYDLGAQWVGPPQKFVQQLGRRANNELMLQNPHGKRILQFGDQIWSYETDLPQNFDELQKFQLQKVINKIQSMAKTVPRDYPRKCQNAAEWDSITIHTWIQLNVKLPKVKRFIELIVRTNYGCQTNEVSFLFFLLYVHQNHGFTTMMNTTGGLQAYKFVKGTQPLSFFLQKQIKLKGGQIHYNSFVDKIVQSNDQVIVSTRDKKSFKANYVIIAGPPQVPRRIQFEPQLSRERRLIADRYIMAAFSKMVLLYDRPYWIQKGYSGEILSDCHEGPVLNAYDQTKPNEKGELQPAIVVLFAAAIEQVWANDKQQLKKETIQALASIYDCPEMRNPIHVEYKVWNQQESIGGAPTAFTPPGILSKIDDIRKPQGLIHWAGTETALISQGYMDGAIQSGIRVSRQILERMNVKVPQVKEPWKTGYQKVSNVPPKSRL